MGVLTNIFGDRQSEKFGDSWLETYFGRYERSAKKNLYESPAIHLVDMWVGHFGCKREANYKLLLPEVLESVIATHGCLRPPNGGIALSLYMLSIEHPKIAARYPKYEAKYGELMGEIMVLEQAKNWEELNKRFNSINPNLKLRSPFPLIPAEHDERGKRLGLW